LTHNVLENQVNQDAVLGSFKHRNSYLLLASFEPMHVNLIGSYSIMKSLYIIHGRNLNNHELAERSGVSTVMWWRQGEGHVATRSQQSRTTGRPCLYSETSLPDTVVVGEISVWNHNVICVCMCVP